jgi:hypothetical protein
VKRCQVGNEQASQGQWTEGSQHLHITPAFIAGCRPMPAFFSRGVQVAELAVIRRAHFQTGGFLAVLAAIHIISQAACVRSSSTELLDELDVPPVQRGQAMEQAPAGAIDAPHQKTFRHRKLRDGVRIDLEIETGKACIDDPA